MLSIRPEGPEDLAAVSDLNRQAFESDTEARLVDELREVEPSIVSLVAQLDDEVVGHILFSPVTIDGTSNETHAVGLGPMAVLPAHQRKGIGSKLVHAGLTICGGMGARIVFVLGHPEYYPRFGFQPAASRGLRYKGEQFDPYFFVKEIEPGALAELSGMVHYHPAFDNA
jgi:putative acetyltransferase